MFGPGQSEETWRVRGGGAKGGGEGFGSQGKREREGDVKVCEKRRRDRAEEPHLQESWTTLTPMETGWTFVLFPLWRLLNSTLASLLASHVCNEG